MMAIGHEGIRPHVEAVREWIPETEEQGFRDHFRPELIKIITVNGEDAGYLKVENHDDHVFVDGIYISCGFRSRGIGARVLTDLLRTASVPVRLRVLRSNPAQRLYARLGFKKVGTTGDSLLMEYSCVIQQRGLWVGSTIR